MLISCPRGTEMFQFPRSASLPPMCSAAGDGTPSRRVSPFGHPRIEACVRLPEAFRSLPRPSSAQSTEASTIRPYSLDRPPGFPGAPAPRRVRRSQRPALLRIHHPSHTSAAPLPCVLRSRALALCACQGARPTWRHQQPYRGRTTCAADDRFGQTAECWWA